MFLKKDKAVLEYIQKLAGVSLQNTKEVFIALTAWIALNYMCNRSSFIPLLGKLDIEYVGDVRKQDGTEAVLNIKIDPTTFFLRTIGQAKDQEKSDIERYAEKFIQSSLKKIQLEPRE